MNKIDLITNISDATGFTKTDTEKVINAFIETVTKELSKGNEVKLIGFGTFSVSHRNATEGRNMQTGESITIPARNVAKFKIGKQLKDAVAKYKAKGSK